MVAVGEIGGDAEERLAKYITETRFPKPVFAYVAGQGGSQRRRGWATPAR